MPDLSFEVMGAEVLRYAAAPTLLFKLHIGNRPPDEAIQAIILRVQIRIQAPQRTYSDSEKRRLRELYGEPGRWSETLRDLLWTHAPVSVPAFTGECVAELPVACTYDSDVVGAKYLYALEGGSVPLLFLFSGTVLYAREGAGLQIAQIPWEKECSFRLPVELWRETMDHYFPNSAWVRMRRDVFDRLVEFKARNAFLTWEDALERLLAHEHARER